MHLSNRFETEGDRGRLRIPHSPLLPPWRLTEEGQSTEGLLRNGLSLVRARTLTLGAQRLSSRTGAGSREVDQRRIASCVICAPQSAPTCTTTRALRTKREQQP